MLKSKREMDLSLLLLGGGAVLGTLIYATSMDDPYGGVAIALLGTIAGTTFTGIGIGKVISNSKKIKRINNIKDSRAPLAGMNLTPNFSYDKFLGTSSTGMRLSIVF